MKRALLAAAGLLLAFAAYQRMSKKPPPPPPPSPPPPIALPAPKPAPILTPEEMRRIQDATQDTDEKVRWEAAKFLAKLEHADADRVLYRMLSRDTSPALRARVAQLLAERAQGQVRQAGGRVDPEVMQALVGALQDTEKPVRLAALRAVASIGNYDVAGSVSELLKDVEEEVRLEAMKTLTSLQEKRVQQQRQEQERLQQELQRKQQEEYRRRQQQQQG